MSAFDELNRAWAEIQHEHDEEQRRALRARAQRVLATIPNGTPDSDLTPEQRQAWRDYEASNQDRDRDAPDPAMEPKT